MKIVRQERSAVVAPFGRRQSHLRAPIPHISRKPPPYPPPHAGEGREGGSRHENANTLETSSQHGDDAVQRLVGRFSVVHHGDPNIVGPRIGAVILVAPAIALWRRPCYRPGLRRRAKEKSPRLDAGSRTDPQ